MNSRPDLFRSPMTSAAARHRWPDCLRCDSRGDRVSTFRPRGWRRPRYDQAARDNQERAAVCKAQQAEVSDCPTAHPLERPMTSSLHESATVFVAGSVHGIGRSGDDGSKVSNSSTTGHIAVYGRGHHARLRAIARSDSPRRAVISSWRRPSSNNFRLDLFLASRRLPTRQV